MLIVDADKEYMYVLYVVRECLFLCTKNTKANELLYWPFPGTVRQLSFIKNDLIDFQNSTCKRILFTHCFWMNVLHVICVGKEIIKMR